MNNLLGKLFFVAGVIAYIAFFIDRSKAYGIIDYHTDVVVIPLLGILAHFAFQGGGRAQEG